MSSELENAVLRGAAGRRAVVWKSRAVGAVRLSAASMWTCGRAAWPRDAAGLRGVMVRRWARGGVVYKNDDNFQL